MKNKLKVIQLALSLRTSRRGPCVGPQHRAHLVRQRRDQIPGDEERRHVEQVQEDLVTIAQSGSKVTVAWNMIRNSDILNQPKGHF